MRNAPQRRPIEEAELLRRVEQAWEDDAAWSVLADLWVEVGDPRGLLVALDLRARAASRHELTELSYQAAQHLRRHREELLGPLARLTGLTWEKGHVTDAVVAPKELLRLSKLPCARLLRRLTIREVTTWWLPRLLNLLDRTRVAELRLLPPFDRDAVVEILATSRLPGSLTDLRLDDCALEDRHALRLVRSRNFKQLRSLDLGGNFLGDATVESLARSRSLPVLERLVLRHNGIGDQGALALRRAGSLPRLRALDLSSNDLSQDALRRVRRARGQAVEVVFGTPCAGRRAQLLRQRSRRALRDRMAGEELKPIAALLWAGVAEFKGRRSRSLSAALRRRPGALAFGRRYYEALVEDWGDRQPAIVAVICDANDLPNLSLTASLAGLLAAHDTPALALVHAPTGASSHGTKVAEEAFDILESWGGPAFVIPRDPDLGVAECTRRGVDRFAGLLSPNRRGMSLPGVFAVLASGGLGLIYTGSGSGTDNARHAVLQALASPPFPSARFDEATGVIGLFVSRAWETREGPIYDAALLVRQAANARADVAFLHLTETGMPRDECHVALLCTGHERAIYDDYGLEREVCG